jgi:hypothetical protein
VFFFAQSLSTTAHALFPVPAWRWVMARAPVQPESSIGGGLAATALQEDRNFTDDVRRQLKICKSMTSACFAGRVFGPVKASSSADFDTGLRTR